ncbi:MAG: hypothetical protein KatS3mg055_1685 [Chloroflexus sp.]|uniref:gamma-glutamylcyclotransferase family protein n=1 Tax=Chloroflexus sp. TaxID=1904827 RepID=UPI0021DBABBB|nr:gamma-glutamylcyclotransferase family protein [Chloroflexus sp.]GIV89167.1 MAG: hypothetical protein KatS3mg055_1685 [Chloroflexus sp.]
MKVLYFAYGSNMSLERLRSRIASVKVIGRAFLKDWNMVLNKRSRDGSGKANLVESPGDVTWGVLYEIHNSDLDTLDRVEGGYQRITVQVQQPDGTVVEAVTYISGNLTNDPRPYRWYKELILSGAREHNLPQDYIARLEGLPVKSDNDPETAG